MRKFGFVLMAISTLGIIGYVTIVLTGKTELTRIPIVDKGQVISATDQSVTNKKYADEAGFSFSYQENLTVNKISTQDESIYSSLELSSKDHSGKLSILVTDTQLTEINAYFDKTLIVKKLKLGELEAGQVETDGQLITVAIDQGALFVITADYQQSKAFWLTVNNKILASFTFALPETTNESVSQDVGDSSYESEIIDEGEEEIN